MSILKDKILIFCLEKKVAKMEEEVYNLESVSDEKIAKDLGKYSQEQLNALEKEISDINSKIDAKLTALEAEMFKLEEEINNIPEISKDFSVLEPAFRLLESVITQHEVRIDKLRYKIAVLGKKLNISLSLFKKPPFLIIFEFPVPVDPVQLLITANTQRLLITDLENQIKKVAEKLAMMSQAKNNK